MAPRRRSETSDDSGNSSTVERLTPTGRRIALIHSQNAPPPSLRQSRHVLGSNFAAQGDISGQWPVLPPPRELTNVLMHKDPVTPDLRRWILLRDGGCIAPVVDLAQLGSCSGRLTLDHVKTESRIGKRAPSDEYHLVTLCEWHHQGQKAGAIWATTKEHREWLRMYLEWVNARP